MRNTYVLNTRERPTIKLVKLSITNYIADVLHKHHITNGTQHKRAQCVLRITQLTKLNFNYPSAVLTADVFHIKKKLH